MGSAKRLLRSNVNLSHGKIKGRLMRLVAGSVRYGANIKLHQVGSIPTSAREERWLQHYVDEYNRLRGKKISTKKLDNLLAKARVITSAVRMQHYLNRKPTVFQILAVEALQHGLDSPSLVQLAARMRAIYQARPNVPWEGSVANVEKAVRFRVPDSSHNLPVAVELLLRHRSRKNNQIEMTSKEIVQALGLNWDNKTMNAINCAMQLLEVCKLVKKMPPVSLANPLSVWVHAQSHSPAITYPNLTLDLIRRLHAGPQESVALHKQHVVVTPRNYPVTIGNPNARFNRGVVKDRLASLEEQGIVKVKASIKVDRRGIPHPIVIYRLTSQGKELYREYLRKGYLVERMRRLLVGEKEI